MKLHSPSHGRARFSGKVRHYHRSAGQTQRTWDDWVEGAGGKPRRPKNRLKIATATIGFLVLGSIIVGLVVELM